jgi:membrane-associated protease RseP (regulator of RpoE activity)
VSESIRTAPLFIDVPHASGRAARPTAAEWRRHIALFLLTAVTATIAGITLVASSSDIPEPHMALPAAWPGYFFYVPEYYLRQVSLIIWQALAHPQLLAQGATFACALLCILAAHEAGHYVACRRYGVDATLPFFIPAPPLFLAGTFGAFIKIKSPIPSRRALFDIGVAGPLAGFVVALPIALAGLLTLQPPAPLTDGAIILNDPLLFQLMARFLHVELMNAQGGPLYFAAWIGLLVTGLNLIPVGQLDGGHATYAVFGTRAHSWLGRSAFIAVATLAILGWLWHGSPSGFLYSVLLAVMLRMRHPQPEDDTPLDRSRMIVALITLLVFALSFTPFPLTIT